MDRVAPLLASAGIGCPHVRGDGPLGAAAVSAMLIGSEMIVRVSWAHSGLAQEMLIAAVEQFLPAAAAAILVTAILWLKAPDALWSLPGLWQIFFSLGIFASRRTLPPAIVLAAVWYLMTGLGCLAFGMADQVFAPWLMGVPFGVGQLLVAGVLQFGDREGDEQP